MRTPNEWNRSDYANPHVRAAGPAANPSMTLNEVALLDRFAAVAGADPDNVRMTLTGGLASSRIVDVHGGPRGRVCFGRDERSRLTGQDRPVGR